MQNQVILARRAYFSAGRRLWNPKWDEERNLEAFGKMASPHGHDYALCVAYSGVPGESDGMIVNITEIKPIIADILDKIDGRFLDREVPFFQTRRPTLENIVNFLWREFPPRLGDGRLARLCIEETSRLRAQKERAHAEDEMFLTRKYEFAAAHRLNAPSLSSDKNEEIYGKCNNSAGHGHNYGLEVTIQGAPDAATGAIMPLSELDRIVDEEIFTRFDHKHLNEDCPDFTDMIPTSENLARVIFEHLKPRLNEGGHRLARVGLHETQKNYFEVEA